MKSLSVFILLIAFAVSGFAQERTAANLTEAYRFESKHSQLFDAYAGQAEEEGLPEVATFFRTIAKASSIHADNFKKVLEKMGVTVSPMKPVIILKDAGLNLDDALYAVRIEAGIKYAEYLDQAKTDGAKSATKALRWAKETEQQSLNIFIKVKDALINGETNTLPEFYWVCPKCGNVYDVPDPEDECSYCYTEKGKFVKVK